MMYGAKIVFVAALATNGCRRFGSYSQSQRRYPQFCQGEGIVRGGVALDGGVITPRDKWNYAFYGRPVKTTEILVKGLKSPQAAGLLKAVAVASREAAQPKARQAPQ